MQRRRCGCNGLVGRKDDPGARGTAFSRRVTPPSCLREVRGGAARRSTAPTTPWRSSPPIHSRGSMWRSFPRARRSANSLLPHAVRAGTLVIDNSSAFRMDDGVPLVVPEVNRPMIFRHKGIIANPNCSTIQMVVPLKPLHDRWTITRIVVSTYQSVTGAGKKGLNQLEDGSCGTNGEGEEIPASDRLQHSSPGGRLPGGRLHEGRAQDDGRDQEDHGG